jgi:hypothetical protein
VAVGIKDVLLTAAKVGVHLAREQSILGDVGLARVLVQWEQENPDDATEHAQERQVGGNLEKARVSPQASELVS